MSAPKPPVRGDVASGGEVRPIRWSRNEIGTRPLPFVLLAACLFFFARLPPGSRPFVAIAGIGLGLGAFALGEFGARTQVLSRAGSRVTIERRWRAPQIVGVGGEHRVLRLPAVGDDASTGGLLWVDGQGRRVWLAKGITWPVHDVEALAEAAGLTVEDDVPADLAREKAT